MNPTKHLSKTLLVSSIAITIALSSAVALAQSDDSKLKTYTDPISGELKVAPRLLSEMSEAEKAVLTIREKQFLKDIEAQIEKEKKAATKRANK